MEKIFSEVKKELEGNILPFWINRMPDSSGGFIGRIDGNGTARPDSEKGAILNARILWTFASAWRILKRDEYLETAGRAFRYITANFLDREAGGVYWSLNPDGTPKDTKKQFYAIAFTIYAFSEYYRASGDKQALGLAVELFRAIEAHSLDKSGDGYIEACTREWGVIEDMRLSEKDQNDAKTMNTHLHILEAYTSLYRVWKDESLAKALEGVIGIFLRRIIRPDGHLGLFFDDNWNSTSEAVSYGHDIEASWLLCEAAGVLGHAEMTDLVKDASRRLAEAAMEGFTPEGGMEYEYDPSIGHRNDSREWWVQAETVVGCVNMYQLTGDEIWMKRAEAQWAFIQKYLVCPDGEWYWSACPSNGSFTANTEDDRAGFWKCPYHNGRMCMELMERI
ncbi:MAG: AGE family epimerase/isomerase [Bacteroidales bacterium]|nr:AGE family epimerase/isomerase [Bacteroidales bacterium]